MIRLISYIAILLSVFFLNACKSFPYEEKDYSLEEVAQYAQTQGIHALVHGADHDRKLYIVSWSSPTNFFNRHNLVINSDIPEIRKKIGELDRGDLIFIQGPVDMNRGQAHLVVKKFELKRIYNDGVTHSDGHFDRESKMPDDLRNKKREIFYVHAIADSGRVIVLEYGDVVVPLISKNPKLTENLYRGDYIDLAFNVHESSVGYRATHILVDEKAEDPVKVLDPIVELHDQKVEYEGRLVMFPKSPTINRNIFAVEVMWKDKSKPARYFTLLPKKFTTKKFEAMLKKLQTAWDKNPENIYKGRNKYIHTKLKVTVKGKGNVVSSNQANPQIFADIEDLKIHNN